MKMIDPSRNETCYCTRDIKGVKEKIVDRLMWREIIVWYVKRENETYTDKKCDVMRLREDPDYCESTLDLPSSWSLL